MQRMRDIIILLALLMATGCGRMMRHQGTATLSPNWADVCDNLGTTVILVSTSPNPELGSAVDELLSKYSKVHVVATQPAPCITDDAEIIRVAKQVNAKTAFVLCISKWEYITGLGAHGLAKYQARVLDTCNGSELLCVNQVCRAYGRTPEEFNATGGEVITWSLGSIMSKP